MVKRLKFFLENENFILQNAFMDDVSGKSAIFWLKYVNKTKWIDFFCFLDLLSNM